MKAKDLKQMSVAELNGKLSDMRKELVKHNAQVALGANIKNSKMIGNIKKDIARILTILSEKTRA